MASQIKAELLKIPPVTRFLCASLLSVTLPVMLQVLSPYQVVFIWRFVIGRWEVWRVPASFFLGGSGISFIFDFVMLYRNADGIESGHYPGRSTDFAWQLLLAAGAIFTLCRPLNAVLHTRPLLITLTYLSAQLAPAGSQSNLFGLITIPLAYYPYLMVGMDLVMAGPAAAASGVVGLVVGHAWWWGVFGGEGGRGRLERWGKAPGWVRTFVSDGPAGVDAGGAGGNADADGERIAREAAGGVSSGGGPVGGVHVITPRSRAGASGGSSTSTSYQWGSGRRLGEN